MTAQLSPAPIFKAWDNNGLPLFLGQLFTYAAGTTTPQATYTDSTQTTQNTNPVVLNARGEANIWLDPTLSYKFVLQDSLGNQIWSIDNIQGALGASGNIVPTADNVFSLGNASFRFANGYFATQLYIGSSNVPVLNGGIVGYWPRTAAEIAAGVTPVSYAYPPFNAIRYGFSTSATGTANAAALNAAISIIGANGGEIIVPAGTYNVAADSITFLNSSITITGAGSAMAYTAPNAGTKLVFGAGTKGFSCTNITNGNDILLRGLNIDGNNVCKYPIWAEGDVLLEHMNVTGSTSAGAGIVLYDLVNETSLSYVSSNSNNGYGILIGASGAGTDANTTLRLDHVICRENLVGMRIEQALHMAVRDSVFESNTHEGVYIYKYTGQTLGNLIFDNCWLENNWAGGTSSDYNLVIDSQTHDLSNGPGAYAYFINCRFNATGSAGAIDVESWRFAHFENCSGAGAVLLNTYASYIGFYNWNGGTITNSGNRCWVGYDDTGSASATGGPNMPVCANPLTVGTSGIEIITKLKGTTAFSAQSTANVTFVTALSSASYQITLSQSASSALPPWWTSKATTGFTINFSANFTGSVDWLVEQ